MNAIIYLVRCLVSGKRYVGQTTMPLTKRWAAHCAAAHSQKPTCTALYAAIRKHGVAAFSVDAIEELSNTDQGTADAREQYWIDALGSAVPNGYNLRAAGSRGAMHPSTRAKIAAAHAGTKRPESWAAHISSALTGQKHPPERVAKMRAGRARKGWAVSDETRAKLSRAGKGRPQHPNQVAALRASWARRRAVA